MHALQSLESSPGCEQRNMRTSHTQFGLRENIASPRQHASRPAVDFRPNTIRIEGGDRDAQSPAVHSDASAASSDTRLYAASLHAATGGERRGESHLLNVREVAEFLRVPVSWVYGRMRKRAPERIPAYRVGKYWQFKADEVMTWLHDTRRQSGSDQMV